VCDYLFVTSGVTPLDAEYLSPDTRQCHAVSLVDIGARCRLMRPDPTAAA